MGKRNRDQDSQEIEELEQDVPDAEPEADEPEVDENEGLVRMTKHGEVLHVHPTTVHAHHAAGWTLG